MIVDGIIILMGYILTFLILFTFWCIFSGYFDAFHLLLGVICSIIVTIFSSHYLFPEPITIESIKRIGRFIGYIPWLIYQIIIANLQVVYLVLHPRMPINPKIITVETTLKDDISRVIMANSITLTPGTITVDIKDNTFWVHSLSDASSSGLINGDIEQKVKTTE
jgi:multicomponent Na+:H+ antiporter subunit E